MERKIGSFVADGDDGRNHTIYIFTELYNATTLDGSGREIIEGLKSLRTSDGRVVHYRAKGRYEILDTGVKLTSNDPSAP